jgi:hypothetical protein
MRHPWLVSTAAVAAVIVTLTGFAPPLVAEGTGAPGFDSPAGGPPPDFCQEGYAHQSGYLAYVQARLQLTADEQPLWDKWQQKLQAAALAERTNCQADRAQQGSRPNAIQREDSFLRMASARIESIKASRPDLQALYGALTPAQQEVFDRLWPPMPPHMRLRAEGGKMGQLGGGAQPPGGQYQGGGQPQGGDQTGMPEP